MSAPVPTCLDCPDQTMIAMSGGFICPKCNAFSGPTPPDPAAELKALIDNFKRSAAGQWWLGINPPGSQVEVTLWPPDSGYSGARSGWYPERPRRKRKPRARHVHVSVSLDTLYSPRYITGLEQR